MAASEEADHASPLRKWHDAANGLLAYVPGLRRAFAGSATDDRHALAVQPVRVEVAALEILTVAVRATRIGAAANPKAADAALLTAECHRALRVKPARSAVDAIPTGAAWVGGADLLRFAGFSGAGAIATVRILLTRLAVRRAPAAAMERAAGHWGARLTGTAVLRLQAPLPAARRRASAVVRKDPDSAVVGAAEHVVEARFSRRE
jgi:hypothetical protein